MLARADGSMTRVLDVPVALPQTEWPERRLFTRSEYYRLGEIGLFEGERVELIGGEIVRKLTPQHSPHAAGIRRAEEALRAVFGRSHDIRVQLPLALAEHSEPEPDVSVVPGSFADYEQEHPTTAVLVVEIADATVRFDRGAKASLYAAAGIPEYWVVNLRERKVEVRTQPGPDERAPFRASHAVAVDRREGESITPLAAPNGSVRVADLLPARRASGR
jgi:Uma2 family endonuclease